MQKAIEKQPVEAITAERIQNRLKYFDWNAHWERVLDKVSPQAEAFERARAASRAQAARKVFV